MISFGWNRIDPTEIKVSSGFHYSVLHGLNKQGYTNWFLRLFVVSMNRFILVYVYCQLSISWTFEPRPSGQEFWRKILQFTLNFCKITWFFRPKKRRNETFFQDYDRFLKQNNNNLDKGARPSQTFLLMGALHFSGNHFLNQQLNSC